MLNLEDILLVKTSLIMLFDSRNRGFFKDFIVDSVYIHVIRQIMFIKKIMKI